jgi:hypothetical protein
MAGPDDASADGDEGEPTSPRGRIGRLILALVAVVAAVAFLAVSTGALPPRAAGPAMPAPGEIWFGARYDPASLALDDPWTTSQQGRPVAAVAHLARPSSPGLSVTMTLDGERVVATTIDVGSGHDFVGLAPGSVLGRVAGRWVVTISDAAGALASGALTVTP